MAYVIRSHTTYNIQHTTYNIQHTHSHTCTLDNLPHTLPLRMERPSLDWSALPTLGVSYVYFVWCVVLCVLCCVIYVVCFRCALEAAGRRFVCRSASYLMHSVSRGTARPYHRGRRSPPRSQEPSTMGARRWGRSP
jgi:hypothetical protein